MKLQLKNKMFSGDTVVLVSVNGPLDIQMKSQNTSQATIEVIYNTKSGRQAVGDRFVHSLQLLTTYFSILIIAKLWALLHYSVIILIVNSNSF